MIDCSSFFAMVDIEESEKPAAEEYIELRGLAEHIELARYLANFIRGRRPRYKEVATSFRYDKRIRRIVYKYVGLIEEYYRAYLFNRFSSPKELGIQPGKALYDYCMNLMLSGLVELVWKTYGGKPAEIWEGKTVLKKNLDAMVRLRNAVSHNRTLIDYRDFLEVSLQNETVGNSLLANMQNLYELLPSSIAEQFKEEINGARRLGGKKRANQTKWELPDFLVLKIS